MKSNYLLGLVSLLCYVLIAYAIPRANFAFFAPVYLVTFGAYFYWCYQAKVLFEKLSLRHFIGAAILLRAVFLFATPELSDDFWRYLWDGRLLSHGINPFRHIPSELLTQDIYKEANLEQIFGYLNSPHFYTVYPPVTQLIFGLATFFCPNSVMGSILFLHGIVLCFEIGTILLLLKLLKLLNKPAYLVFFYAFNPLVIIELSGNLHTEGYLIFFLSGAFYYLKKNELHKSAAVFSLAVGAKLLPLMFMPLLLNRLWFKKGVLYCTIVGGLSILLFIPFFDIELLLKIRESVVLYFAHFEFNASVYYVIRYGIINEYWWIWEYHDYFREYPQVEELLRYDWYVLLRKFLPILDLIIILGFSVRKSVRTTEKTFLLSFLFIYSVHFFLATTIHPWYICTFVFFSILTNYRYALLWSCLVGLTYISYQGGSFAENSYIIGLEYLVVLFFLIYERRRERQISF